MKNCEPEIKRIGDDLYCTMLVHVIEDQMLINYSEKVITNESKLSVRSITPYTKTQVNFLNGNQFFGDMNECRITGNGRYLWGEDESLYEGEFKLPNVIHGQGSFKFQNRQKSKGFSKYCGCFSNGKPEGKGQLTNYFFKFNGHFEQDKFHGRGSIVSGLESFDGLFEYDQKIYGKRVYSDGFFTGDFNDDETRKFGKYEFDNGDVYLGSFEDGKFSGFGEYSWAWENSIVGKYKGHWRNNYRDGLGMIKINEMICITLFRKNYKNGPAILWAKNGKVYASNKMFEHDIFLSCEEIDINQQNFGILRKLMNLEKLRLECFNAMLALLLKDFGKRIEVLYPYHVCWLDLKVEHAAIWDFVRVYPGTNKEQEFSSIRQVVKEHFNAFQCLHSWYGSYSSNFDEKDGVGLLRIGLWQFMRDLELFKKSPLFNTQEILDEADRELDIFSMNPYDPFEVVPISSLAHYLMYLTLYMNKHHDYVWSCAMEQRSKVFGLFATMFIIFLREFLYPLLATKSFEGMIPKLIQDDRTLFIKLRKILNTKNLKLTIRDVFKVIELWKTRQQVEVSKRDIGNS